MDIPPGATDNFSSSDSEAITNAQAAKVRQTNAEKEPVNLQEKIAEAKKLLKQIKSANWRINITDYGEECMVAHIMANDGEVYYADGEGAIEEIELRKAMNPEVLYAILIPFNEDSIIDNDEILSAMMDIREIIEAYDLREWKGLFLSGYPVSSKFARDYPEKGILYDLYDCLSPGVMYDVLGFMIETSRRNISARLSEINSEKAKLKRYLTLSITETKSIKSSVEEQADTPEFDDFEAPCNDDDDLPF